MAKKTQKESNPEKTKRESSKRKKKQKDEASGSRFSAIILLVITVVLGLTFFMWGNVDDVEIIAPSIPGLGGSTEIILD